ncbi:MAG: preprotein translocase subunit SecA [Sarcina sp.]
MSIFNYSEREIKKLDVMAEQILRLDYSMSRLSDVDLFIKTEEFKDKLKNGQSFDDILIEAFAVCREASFRILGKKQYKVQLMGGIAMHQGRVVEMKTGEGKTLTELCPAYLNSLTGKGVHIITVNDYLAKRDKEEMAPLFEFLGISVGLVIQNTENRREEYRKDVIYTTNTDVGFDYLRDNLVFEVQEKVLRRLNYALIDEIDSIFIDEARTPLIISAKGDKPTKLYYYITKLIGKMNESDYDRDYEKDAIVLTESGISKVEKVLELDTIADTRYSEITHVISQALRAQFILEKDKDYIVEDGEVILIDQNTGRIADGRRLSNGLHQCLEAKEGVEIKGESKTLGTITYQNLFKLYKKVSGMSGTVKTEELEFKEIYNLDVVVIPTHKGVRRVDYEDLIYLNKKEKYKAIIKDIINSSRDGRPILVGTISIQDSEILSKLLNELNVEHNLLTAKTKEEEAEIVARAGAKRAITIATSVAGRGTDIKISNEINNLGGLKVIGVERAESERIDNQLIGRAGRQGNNGSSQFYISLDDELFINNSKKDLKKNYDRPDSDYLRKEVKKLQRLVSSKEFQERKDNTKYDEAVNRHRRIIYKERDMILFGKDIRLTVTSMILDVNTKFISELFEKYSEFNRGKLVNFDKQNFYLKLIEEFNKRYNFSFDEVYDYMMGIDDLAEVIQYCTDQIIDYLNRLLELGIIDFKDHLRRNFLLLIDQNWVKHIKGMELLKQRVKNQGYNQKDPVQVYNKESLRLYNEMLDALKFDFVEALFTVVIPSLVEEYENQEQEEEFYEEEPVNYEEESVVYEEEPINNEEEFVNKDIYNEDSDQATDMYDDGDKENISPYVQGEEDNQNLEEFYEHENQKTEDAQEFIDANEDNYNNPGLEFVDSIDEKNSEDEGFEIQEDFENNEYLEASIAEDENNNESEVNYGLIQNRVFTDAELDDFEEAEEISNEQNKELLKVQYKDIRPKYTSERYIVNSSSNNRVEKVENVEVNPNESKNHSSKRQRERYILDHWDDNEILDLYLRAHKRKKTEKKGFWEYIRKQDELYKDKRYELEDTREYSMHTMRKKLREADYEKRMNDLINKRK